MKKSIFFLLLSSLCLFISCLKSGLDEIEDSDLYAISSISMEHRWITQNANGYDQLSRQPMTLSNKIPNENNEIRFTVTVPAVSASFPASERSNVALNGLYMISIISSAAKISPLNGAPTLGVPGAYQVGETYQYEVTAASGKKAVYRIIIEDFVK